jgi:hypothetical protein
MNTFVCFMASLFLHTIFRNEFSVLDFQSDKFSEKKQILFDKNKKKINKIVNILKWNPKILTENRLKHFTVYKYHYDFTRPIRRIIDIDRFIHFRDLSCVRKIGLILKYVFYGFYHSL